VKFLIRDDDTCAFTAPEELIDCYGEIWGTIPVGLAVTPFRIPGDHPAVPHRVRGMTDPLPLEQNGEITAFLREQSAAGRVEVLLHGYHHTKPRGLPEYVGATDLVRKTREGKAYLEQLLDCRIDTFVPPNNGIGREGLQGVVAAGLNLVNVPSLLRHGIRPFHPVNLVNYARIRYYRTRFGMRYPHVLVFPDHREVDYFAITPSQEMARLTDDFHRCRDRDGIFVAAVHYHAFERRLASGETIRRALETLIEMALATPGIEFPYFRQIWSC